MFSLYLHRDITLVIILFCFSPKHESNAYSLVWQMGGITVETEDLCYHSNPLLLHAFISIELIIMKRLFSQFSIRCFWTACRESVNMLDGVRMKNV